MKRKILLYSVMLVALILLMITDWISGNSTSLPISSVSVSINSDAPYIYIDATSSKADYICLSSSEYGQLYLPIEFECDSCFISDESQQLIDRPWSPDTMLLVLKADNSLSVREVDLSKVTSRGFYTWYSGIANHPDSNLALSQCTGERSAVAHCSEQSGDCLFLFEDNQTADGEKNER